MTDHTLNIPTLTFEQALRELESIVSKMEGSQLSLEDAIAAYEVGSTLKKHCEEILRKAKLRVDSITVAQDGSVSLEPMDPEKP